MAESGFSETNADAATNVDALPAAARVRSRIFILAGQSNMVGRADPATYPPLDPVPLMFDNDGHFPLVGDATRARSDGYVVLQAQRSAWNKTADGAYRMHLGPEASLKLSAEGVHLAKFARGSTKMREHWHPESGKSYAEFVAFCRDALETAPQPAEFAGLFWLQGEGDVGKPSSSYAKDFADFVRALRHDLSTPALPVVASHIVWNKKEEDVAKLNAKLNEATSQLLEHACCVSAEGYVMDPNDQWHMDSTSVMSAGERMGRAWSDLAAGRCVPPPSIQPPAAAAPDASARAPPPTAEPPEGEQQALLDRWHSLLAEEPPRSKGRGKPPDEEIERCRRFAERKKSFLAESDVAPFARWLAKQK